jgi:hypothetical protein
MHSNIYRLQVLASSVRVPAFNGGAPPIANFGCFADERQVSQFFHMALKT